MKVTSDRIKARAEQLRNGGFRLSGTMVRRTLEMNAGAGAQISAKASVEQKEQDAENRKPASDKIEAA